MSNKRKNDSIDDKKRKKYNDDLDEYYNLDAKTNKCNNPLCDHSHKGKLIDIKNIEFNKCYNFIIIDKYNPYLYKRYINIEYSDIYEFIED